MNSNDISWETIKSYFKDSNLIVNHHISSFNTFFSKGIINIFLDNNPIKFFKELDDETKQYKYECNLYLGGIDGKKIYYGKPIIYDSDDGIEREHYMYPNEARLRNMTYGFTIHYDVDVVFKILIEKNDGSTGMNKFRVYNETIVLEKIYLGKFPIMLQSNMCLLNTLAPEIRFNLGECRNDPGGYFIIDGKEKVIVSQEGRADNMLYILKDINDLYSYAAEIRSVSEDASKPIRTLSVRIVKEQLTLSNNQIVVNIPQVRKPVPLFIVMRALGIISDKDIIKTCLLDLEKYNDYIDLFIPSIHDAGNIFTQKTALHFIGTLTKGKTIQHVLQILMNYFLPHIGELNFKAKALYLGYVVKRLLNVYIGAEKPTNRDSYKYKRIEVSGILLHKLFREYYKKQQDNIYLKIDKEYFYKHNQTSYQDEDFINLILANKVNFFQDRIVETGFKKAFKGDWGAAAHTKRPGVVQSLNRLSYWGFLCQLRKTNLHIGSDGAKIIEPRLLNSTQYGLLCPLHSPDGGNVGLHKHLSTSTHITSGCSGLPFLSYLRNIEGGIKLLEECSLSYLTNATKIFINGAWIGCTHNPLKIVNIMKLHKRNNKIDIYTSIYFNFARNEINICTDAGRPIRPLFYMMNQKLSYERENVLDEYKNKTINRNKIIYGFGKQDNLLDKKCKINISKQSIESLIKNASVIEYIDTQEAEGMVLAHSNDQRENYENKRITHCEIHPSLILGLMANQIIFPENNPYPRDAFSCGQAKQSVSLYHSNYQNRLDKSAFVLNYGQIPLTKSRYLNFTTQEEHPYGENAIVAIMCYSGYNVEDAIIVNEGSLKRGLFSTTYYNTYEAHEEQEKVGNLSISSKFMNVNDVNITGLKPGYDYSNLDVKTGIIKENTIVTDKSVIIGKATNSITALDTYIDNSIVAKKGQVGIVDKAFITKGEEGTRISKVRIRAERIPHIGDKFCSRAGQKGTIGIVLREQDMPCTKDGIRPDIIVNPHAMPSRMTIGHLVETIISKVGSVYGAFGDCTAFQNKGSKHKEFGELLTRSGYHSSGCQILYNGMTGEQLESEIYFGPTYYLRLKHMPKDKINYRARGPRTVLTRQTVQGRANNGGLRIGEMDRDCLISHGMAGFIKESMLVRGDQFYMAICNKTGCIAIYNKSKKIFLSPMADGPMKFIGNLENELNIVNISKYGRDFSIIRVPYCFKLLMQELQAMNIQMRVVTEDNVDQLLSLTQGDDVIKLTGLDDLDQITGTIKSKKKDFDKKPSFVSSMKENISYEEKSVIKFAPPSAIDEPVGVNPYAPPGVYPPDIDPNRFKVGDKVKIIKGDDTESVFIIEAFDPDTREYIVVKEGTQNFKEEDAEVEMEVEYGTNLKYATESSSSKPLSISIPTSSPTSPPPSPEYIPSSPIYDDGEPGYPASPIQLSKKTFTKGRGGEGEGEEGKEGKEKIKTSIKILNEPATIGLDKLSKIEDDDEDKKEKGVGNVGIKKIT